MLLLDFNGIRLNEFVENCIVCAQISNFMNFCLLTLVETSYPFRLVYLDTSYLTMSLGNMKYTIVPTDHLSC